MTNPPIKFKDESMDIKEQWKIYCRTIYTRILKMEKKLVDKFHSSRKIGVPYIERKVIQDKIVRCSNLKKKIEQSVKTKQFVLEEYDYEVINDKGFDYYFKYLDGSLV